MRKVDLGQQDGPYEHQGYQSAYTTEYEFQAFAENGKAVFIFSDTPQNYSDEGKQPLENSIQMTGAVRETLNELGIKDVNNVDVIYHQPENVTGNNPEKFEKVDYEFDLNGLHEQHRNERQDLTAEQVAEKVGPENFVEKQYAQEASVKEEVSQTSAHEYDLSKEQMFDH